MNTVKERFWTNMEQARSRLTGSVVFYEDEPVQITDVFRGESDGLLRGLVKFISTGAQTSKRLDSPRFQGFRKIPSPGFLNLFNKNVKHVHFLSRRPVRTVVHGLHSNNTQMASFGPHNGDNDVLSTRNAALMFENAVAMPGFATSLKRDYPSFQECFQNLCPDSSAAFHKDFALYKDPMSWTWLFRQDVRAGLVLTPTSLLLGQGSRYMLEEIEEIDQFEDVTTRLM